MGKPSKPRTKFPYYKVHIYDDVKLAWIDARKEAFNTLEEAKIYIDEALPNQKARILEVNERGRHVYNEK
jgi:hypothetical protein